ncbi:GNAT family N-acetyltransferase [Schaedlerella sp.]|jgi:purine-nucleoside phosphorylase/GNAT superfamily N-acetyltransferase|uniref:GNAT family N-acetyltransferase n=1 Tax=Schaedlerella sp. TaxID=2676057 RepID=UPI001362EAF3|nr:GNAT family N-acetyltransferase [uncultured Schaedlerella sp.]MCI8769064.1 GNAT family N-acetyltransferase [Ruminococcus sp.]NBJ03702.1 GNAT family N-acetyltransferase [Lachnospiraceae bacterium]
MSNKRMIHKAKKEQAKIITDIVSTTIREIYTNYYPEEVVCFFLELHQLANIEKDISEEKTYVITHGETIAGTGTIEGNRISRVYVLPEHQGAGIGSALMDYLENEIIKSHGSVEIEASLPAGEFYRKRHYVQKTHVDYPVANGKILSYEVMQKRHFDIDPEVYNAPVQLVKKECELQGLNYDELRSKIPSRVYLLADSLYDTTLARNVGALKYQVGGELYVMTHNTQIGFVKGEMCSPGIATQAEDLFAAGVKELIHVGFAGGRIGTRIGEYVISNGAFHDTAIAGLYGFHDEIIETSKELTEALCKEMDMAGLKYHRGYHWTTDAGYVETDWSIRYYEEKGAKCVEMEGAGLFTTAKFRSCKATGIYIISDSGTNEEWELGWGNEKLEQSIQNLIDAIINSTAG